MNFRRFGLILCLLPSLLFAQAFQWTTFTSTTNVSDLLISADHVWTATSGGVADFNLQSGTFDIYTNTRGLVVNQATTVEVDAHGFVWAGLATGLITRIHPTTGQVRQIDDLQQGGVFEITDILRVGDEIFVSANNGIYRFSYFPAADNYRVREPIRNLGNFPAETRVVGLTVSGGYLYAATVIGLARADFSSPTLSQPSAWETFTTTGGVLPENSILALEGYDDGLLLIATPAHILRYDETGFVVESDIGGVVDFSHMSEGGRLFAALPWQALVRENGAWGTIGGALAELRNLEVVTLDGTPTLVAGLGDSPLGSGGIAVAAWPDGEWSAPNRAPGIGGNDVSTLFVDPEGRLWVGGGSSSMGIYMREGESWRNYNTTTGYSQRLFNSVTLNFTQDDFGGVWAGSAGAGLARFYADTFLVFNATDSATFYNDQGTLRPRVQGISGFPNYHEMQVARSSRGDIWATNLEAANEVALLRIPAEWIARGNNTDPWSYYVPDANGQDDRFNATGLVIVDQFDHVWCGAGRNGDQTFVLDTRGTPADTTNDRWNAFLPSNVQDPVTCYEAINNEVLDWDLDSQGYLWIGTANGAYYTQGGAPEDIRQIRFICLIDLPVGRRVNAVHVDAQDNKWFGTDEGVAVLDKNFNWIHVFQSAMSVSNRSDLISNIVTSIASNPLTGEIWIGTNDGLSRYMSPYVSTGGDLDELWPYPNPFRADGTQRMRLDPPRLGGRFDDLRIYTVSGRLVRKLDWRHMTDPQASGGWDGRNDDGDLVAGGVYILVASSNEGQSVTGKIAVLGR